MRLWDSDGDGWREDDMGAELPPDEEEVPLARACRTLTDNLHTLADALRELNDTLDVMKQRELNRRVLSQIYDCPVDLVDDMVRIRLEEC